MEGSVLDVLAEINRQQDVLTNRESLAKDCLAAAQRQAQLLATVSEQVAYDGESGLYRLVLSPAPLVETAPISVQLSENA